MNKQTAEDLAKKFLCDKIELEVYSEIPSEIGFYQINIEDVILVRFSLFENPDGFGASQFVTVSKTDGSVNYIGYQGD